MAGIKVGDLRGELGLDDRDFVKGLKDSERRFRQTKDDIEKDKIRPEVDPSKASSGFGDMMSTLKTVGLGAAAGIGAAVGAVVMSEMAASMGRSTERAQLQASMGLSPDQAKAMGKIAGELYSQAYGESTKDVMAGVQATLGMGGLGDMGSDEFKDLTKQALSLAAVMGEDVGAVTRSASNLMRNGLAKNAQEAFDIIAAGQQQGANVAGDLLDTIDEYSVKFSQLGLTGPQVMNMLVAGMKAGARDTDFMADAYKELQISATDGSAATTTAMGKLGLNADDIKRKLLEGGPAAAEATAQITTALNGITDPVARNEIGLALFKSKWEDLGPAALGAMGQAQTGLTNFEGKAREVDTTMSQTSAGWWESVKRQFFAPMGQWLDENLTPEALDMGATMIRDGWGTIVADVFDPIGGSLQAVWDKFTGLGDWMRDNVGTADDFWNGMGKIGDGFIWIKDHGIDPVVGALQGLWDWLQKIIDNPVFKFIQAAGTGNAGGAFDVLKGVIPGFDSGGVVGGGPTGSARLIVAHVGETVLPTHQMPFDRAAASVVNNTSRQVTNNVTVTAASHPTASALATRNALARISAMAA